MSDDQCPACTDGTCLECDGDGCGTCDSTGDCPECDGTGIYEPHSGCYQPHRDADGYVNCDGQPV